MTIQPNQEQHMLISRRFFMLKSGILSISLGRYYITSISRIFLNTNVNYTWSNHWFHHNTRSLLPIALKCKIAYCNHWLVIEIGRWTIIPISRDTRLCHFCSCNAIKNEAHFMSECLLYNPFKDKFSSLFENVVLGSHKSFFQSNQQVNISYLMEATTLCHTRKLIGLKPS